MDRPLFPFLYRSDTDAKICCKPALAHVDLFCEFAAVSISSGIWTTQASFSPLANARDCFALAIIRSPGVGFFLAIISYLSKRPDECLNLYVKDGYSSNATVVFLDRSLTRHNRLRSLWSDSPP